MIRVQIMWQIMSGDAITHIVTVVLISGAIVLNPTGTAIKAPTQLIFIANVATSIATPVAGLFMVLILWKDELFAGVQTPRVFNFQCSSLYFSPINTTEVLDNSGEMNL